MCSASRVTDSWPWRIWIKVVFQDLLTFSLQVGADREKGTVGQTLDNGLVFGQGVVPAEFGFPAFFVFRG